MQEHPTWPPPHRIRRNRRSKHVSLRVTDEEGLIVTLPYRFSEKRVPLILLEHRDWIDKQLTKWAERKKSHIDILPQQIELKAINETWNIYYNPAIRRRTKFSVLDNDNFILQIHEDAANITECKQLIQKWLIQKAKMHLPILLRSLSQETGLLFNNITIRSQKTLWGSCTPTHNINLNYKLLLMDWPTARMIMLHELCHTVHLNHSKRFWRLLEKFEPNYKELRKQIRKI